jgi:hypothetical protein
MPTIEELFRSKKLSSGKTAEQEYAVRNSKDNELTSAGGLMGLPFKAATAIRRKASVVGKETLIEEETTGLRIISKLSSPIIYGTKIGRFTLQQSDDVEEMKSAKNVSAGNGGLLGGLVNSVRGAINSVKSVLGVPQNITPTKIYLNKTEFNSESIPSYKTRIVLDKIKKNAAGSLLGKFISQNINGTPGQIGDTIPGAAAEAGKKALKNLLLGSGNSGQINLAKNQGNSYGIYASARWGDKIPLDEFFLFASNPMQSSSTRENLYSNSKKRRDDNIYDRNDLSTSWTVIQDDGRFPEKTNILKKQGDGVYTKVQKKRFNQYSLQSKLGLATNETDNGHQTYGKNIDKLNTLITYQPDKNGIGTDEGTFKSYDDLDFVALKFYSIAKDRTVQFRATITGLTETYSPSWDSQKFIGNPFNFYTYSGIERSVQFNFKVYSLSVEEHIAAWKRLNFLSSLVYPTYGGTGGVYTIPPFLKFTLGNMFKHKECFIDSLIYTIDDNNVWETGIPFVALSDNGVVNVAEKRSAAANYKLPTIIDVGITLKFVESKSSTNELTTTHYGYSNSPAGKVIVGEPASTPPPPNTLQDVTVVSSKKLKTMGNGVIANANNIAAASKASADKLLNMKLSDKISLQAKMAPEPINLNGGTGTKQYFIKDEYGQTKQVTQQELESEAGITNNALGNAAVTNQF